MPEVRGSWGLGVPEVGFRVPGSEFRVGLGVESYEFQWESVWG